MNIELAPGWNTDLERGPDWLFIRLHRPARRDERARGLAGWVHDLMAQEMAHRAVLELDELSEMPADLPEELVALHDLLERGGGLVRLCGVPAAYRGLFEDQADGPRLTVYGSRAEAVLGHRPGKPR